MGDIRVEVVSTVGDYGQDLAGPPMPELFSARAGEIADSVAEVATQFRARIDEAVSREETDGWQLGQVEVAFGLQAEAGAGVLIARASAGATFTATLTWTR
jgi:Trypsin-co-occurring domain 1